MRLLSTAMTYTPKNKQISQDSYYIDDSIGLYIISDGIGGYAHSEIASQLIVKIIPEELKKNRLDEKSNIKSILHKIIRIAAIELNKIGQNKPLLNKISTTLTLLFIHKEKYWIAQVGDSRAYLFRNNHLKQITEDHSVAFEQYKIGAIKKEDIQLHPNQKLLTRCFSAAKDFVLSDIFEDKIQDNDIFLLCSDGLTKEVKDIEISEVLTLESDIFQNSGQLIEKVKLRNGKDDTTIILLLINI
ncbi:MAG: serine/threonine-protein phosphatase [Desulfobacterales bacterium]|nr:serine/threonine-protein phosphatase [Desulfobacterales bacterium]